MQHSRLNKEPETEYKIFLRMTTAAALNNYNMLLTRRECSISSLAILKTFKKDCWQHWRMFDHSYIK